MAKRIAVSFVGYEGAGQAVNTTVPSVTGASDSSAQSNEREYESLATYSSFRPKPLDVYLDERDRSSQTRLSVLSEAALEEPFDLSTFREALVAKLRVLQYPQPPERKLDQTTFHDRLQSAGALEDLLRKSTLMKIHYCLLLSKVAQKDKEYEEREQSVYEYPLRFHWKMVKSLMRHGEEYWRLAEEHGVEEGWIKKYDEEVGRQIRKECRALMMSKYPGSRAVLLGGHRSVNLATQEAIYCFLADKFDKKLSRRFIRQLVLLICAPADVRELGSDEGLRKAIERRPDKTG